MALSLRKLLPEWLDFSTLEVFPALHADDA